MLYVNGGGGMIYRLYSSNVPLQFGLSILILK